MLRLAALIAAVTSLLAGAPASADATVTVARPVPCVGRCHRPPAASTFFWQLSGTVRAGRRATVYDVDAVDTPVRTVEALHARGRLVTCYVDAGSWEPGRPDSARWPAGRLGKELDGWPGERWVDVRRIAQLAPLLRARIDVCAAKGFDAVEFDNVDGYANDTGFAISAAHQVRFNRFLANAAHRRGLAVALKNDVEQVPQLQPWFDFAVVEQCFQYDECAGYTPFVRAGKPVFVTEYELALGSFCPAAHRLGMFAARATLALDGHVAPCSR
ncbi:MAG: hypothetical protein JWM98_260 [Thermoleophilia bacterium]|nr:hypothetical protein [Thermoleophilia bacterium]